MRNRVGVLAAVACAAAMSGGVWAAGAVASDAMRARPVLTP